MGGELITAIVAVLLSVVGILYTRVQTKTAEQAAQSAKDQVELMRQQFEGEEAARFQSGGPAFVVDRAVVDEANANVPRAVLHLRQVSGPRLTSVVICATGAGVEGLRGARDAALPWEYRRESSIDLGESTAGARHDVHVDLDYNTRETIVHLTLACVSGEGKRWERSAGASVEQAVPEPPRGRRARFRGL